MRARWKEMHTLPIGNCLIDIWVFLNACVVPSANVEDKGKHEPRRMSHTMEGVRTFRSIPLRHDIG